MFLIIASAYVGKAKMERTNDFCRHSFIPMMNEVAAELIFDGTKENWNKPIRERKICEFAWYLILAGFNVL